MKPKMFALIAAVIILFLLALASGAVSAQQVGGETTVAQSALPRMPEGQPVVTLAVGEYNGEWTAGPLSDVFYLKIKRVNGVECSGTLYMTMNTTDRTRSYFNTPLQFTGIVVGDRLRITARQFSLDLAIIRTKEGRNVLDGTAQALTRSLAVTVRQSK